MRIEEPNAEEKELVDAIRALCGKRESAIAYRIGDKGLCFFSNLSPRGLYYLSRTINEHLNEWRRTPLECNIMPGDYFLAEGVYAGIEDNTVVLKTERYVDLDLHVHYIVLTKEVCVPLGKLLVNTLL